MAVFALAVVEMVGSSGQEENTVVIVFDKEFGEPEPDGNLGERGLGGSEVKFLSTNWQKSTPDEPKAPFEDDVIV
ncbi:hypothetical protein COLO4_00004 [Corchorus olitorius]|uniref:Uncharacterized protein n=1 Tax=Corchorus olitorius TaxID=93759 RepID=A0A1R3L4W9_9ROSI|nr:hypothetical protein COLO4_00004 [Corchorus olitorius]